MCTLEGHRVFWLRIREVKNQTFCSMLEVCTINLCQYNTVVLRYEASCVFMILFFNNQGARISLMKSRNAICMQVCYKKIRCIIKPPAPRTQRRNLFMRCFVLPFCFILIMCIWYTLSFAMCFTTKNMSW